MIKQLRQWLHEPKVRGVNVDDNALLALHTSILREKQLLRSAFETFYRDMAGLCDRFLSVPGLEVELGTGAGFFKSMRPALGAVTDGRPSLVEKRTEVDVFVGENFCRHGPRRERSTCRPAW